MANVQDRITKLERRRRHLAPRLSSERRKYLTDKAVLKGDQEALRELEQYRSSPIDDPVRRAAALAAGLRAAPNGGDHRHQRARPALWSRTRWPGAEDPGPKGQLPFAGRQRSGHLLPPGSERLSKPFNSLAARSATNTPISCCRTLPQPPCASSPCGPMALWIQFASPHGSKNTRMPCAPCPVISATALPMLLMPPRRLITSQPSGAMPSKPTSATRSAS